MASQAGAAGVPKTFAREVEVWEAMAQAHALDKALLLTRLERLTALLQEHGVPLPEEDPALGASDGQHLEACRLVVTKAYELLEALEDLKALVGSGMELVEKEIWR